MPWSYVALNYCSTRSTASKWTMVHSRGGGGGGGDHSRILYELTQLRIAKSQIRWSHIHQVRKTSDNTVITSVHIRINYFWTVTFWQPIISIQRCLYGVAMPHPRNQASEFSCCLTGILGYRHCRTQRICFAVQMPWTSVIDKGNSVVELVAQRLLPWPLQQVIPTVFAQEEKNYSFVFLLTTSARQRAFEVPWIIFQWLAEKSFFAGELLLRRFFRN